jgi:hypothetical protein
VYARRVWDSVKDGGCWCLAKALAAPGAALDSCGKPGGRSMLVTDYASGYFIR